MEQRMLRQIRVLQVAFGCLLILTLSLCVNLCHPFLPEHARVIDAERINIREPDGTIKAVLANSATFSSEGDRAKGGGVPFSGLMFYNQEGDEEGGLVYDGKAIPGGQDADVSLTFDQYRQDQDVYLHHEEQKDEKGSSIDDGLAIISRPDWTQSKKEFSIYSQLSKLPQDQQEAVRLKALQNGEISTRRLFFGLRKGVEHNGPYDDAGLFIKNRWGRDAIKLYVDYDNKPHFEVYDALGHKIVYELKPSL
jgi:hypothetical protein